MSTSFSFARTFAPKVTEDLNLAEDYLYAWNDPHGCMLKVGAAIEDLVVNHIALKQMLVSPFEAKPNLQEHIELLDKMGSCPKKIIQAMDYIRKRRNRANHERLDKEYDARECLKQAHRILNWCVEYYGLGKAISYQPINEPFMFNVGFEEEVTLFRLNEVERAN